jgi:hypothetical protein
LRQEIRPQAAQAHSLGRYQQAKKKEKRRNIEKRTDKVGE